MLKKIAFVFLFFLLLSQVVYKVNAQSAEYPAPESFYIEAEGVSGCNLTGEANQVTLHWSSVEGAESYRTQIFEPNGEQIFSSPTDSTYSTIYLNNKLGVWKFKVRVFDDGQNYGEFSRECTFTNEKGPVVNLDPDEEQEEEEETTGSTMKEDKEEGSANTLESFFENTLGEFDSNTGIYTWAYAAYLVIPVCFSVLVVGIVGAVIIFVIRKKGNKG